MTNRILCIEVLMRIPFGQLETSPSRQLESSYARMPFEHNTAITVPHAHLTATTLTWSGSQLRYQLGRV